MGVCVFVFVRMNACVQVCLRAHLSTCAVRFPSCVRARACCIAAPVCLCVSVSVRVSVSVSVSVIVSVHVHVYLYVWLFVCLCACVCVFEGEVHWLVSSSVSCSVERPTHSPTFSVLTRDSCPLVSSCPLSLFGYACANKWLLPPPRSKDPSRLFPLRSPHHQHPRHQRPPGGQRQLWPQHHQNRQRQRGRRGWTTSPSPRARWGH